MSVLAETWQRKPLKALCAMNERALSENTDPDRIIDYIDIGSVSHTHGIERCEQILFEDAPSRARRIVRDGDIIISTVRTYLRAIARVGLENDGAIASTGFAVCRTNDDNHSGFLYYATMAEPFMNEVVTLSTGISYPAINATTLGNVRLPVPRIDKQESIADYLDRETGRIDALIEEKGQFVALLREKRVAVVSHAVTKGLDPSAPMKPSEQDWLGDVPAHWDVVRLASLYREVERKSNPDLPVLSVSIHAGVSDDEIANEDRDRRVALSEDRNKYQGVLPGDLVYNMMRAWQGAFGAVRSPGLISPAYVVAAPITDVRTKFVELQFRTPQAIEEMRRYSKGIADFRMRLYWDRLRDVKVAIPKASEQDAILQSIEGETTRIDALIAETERSIALLREKRAAEITAAVTGHIDVRNAA